ncbi:MAG: hypothetical protein ABS76_04795 [Pelagibacterium sp. SCN 64-44]|nr:MAG: hypothetical protein ABS76_04795 [Pelagibacterium sp. SCN 64-44]
MSGAARFSGLFVALALLALWTQAQPFASLSSHGVLDDPTQSSLLRRNLTLLILALFLALVWRRGRLDQLRRAMGWLVPLLFAWFAFCALLGASPGLALNRLALSGITLVIAFCLPLVFERLGDFVLVLGLAASLAVALCFLGALFVPDLAIHSLRDAVEQGLAGDWRGMFRHKNDLAPMSVHFILVGLLLRQIGWRFWGLALMAGALALLLLSGGKTSALLLVPALFGAMALLRLGDRAGAPLVLLLVGGLALVTLGGVAFPPVAALVAHLPDPSFTGRTDIWRLGLEAAAARPVTGYGYAVFWDTGVTYAVAGSGDTAAQVSHAHNGFVENALAAGLPGLMLVLAFTLFAPLGHIAAIRPRCDDPKARAFLQFLIANWLFVLMSASLESVLFNRGDSIWFTGLLALACLRYWSRAELAP